MDYVVCGLRSGIPLVLLHGVSDSWRSFERVLPLLPEWIRAIAVTQRGHGDSSKPETGYRWPDFAGDVAAFMDALELERAIVVGHSMGSMVGQYFAGAYPDRTMGLGLVGAFAGLKENVGAREVWDVVATFKETVDPAFVREFQESTMSRPVPPEFLEMVISESMKLPAYVWRECFRGFFEEPPADRSKIRARTRMFWGDQDVFCKRTDQDRLLKEIRGSSIVVYEGVGHTPQWEVPEQFARDLAVFVKENCGTRI